MSVWACEPQGLTDSGIFFSHKTRLESKRVRLLSSLVYLLLCWTAAVCRLILYVISVDHQGKPPPNGHWP